MIGIAGKLQYHILQMENTMGGMKKIKNGSAGTHKKLIKKLTF
jgi:hypothetical protein